MAPKYPPSYSVSFFTPPQVVWSWTASLFHHLHHPSKLIPPALTAMFSSGQVVRRVVWCGGTDCSCSPVKDRPGGSGVFRCRQNEETEEGGLLALGCRSGRLSTDQTVTGCCLCACCCFCSFTRTPWMDGLSRQVPQVGQGYPSSLWETPYYKIKLKKREMILNGSYLYWNSFILFMGCFRFKLSPNTVRICFAKITIAK